MSRQVSPQFTGFEVQVDSPTGRILLPPPRSPREATFNNTGRRNVVAPPSLTTTLPGLQGSLHHSTPLTTTSLSSPFSVNNPAMYGLALNPPSRGVSPMTSRQSIHFNVPYDPRNWASGVQRVDSTTRQVDRGDDGLDSPPPPYTLPEASATTRRSLSAVVQPPSASAYVRRSSGFTSIPQSAPAGTSPAPFAVSGQTISPPLPPPPQSRGPSSTRSPQSVGYYPSPLAQVDTRGGHALTQNSVADEGIHTNTMVIQMDSSSNIGPPLPRRYMPQATARPVSMYIDPSNLALQAPGSRRAVSTDAVPHSNVSNLPQEPGPSQPITQQSGWHPGMPLPGPPARPPPPSSSRSQSANSAGDQVSSVVDSRKRPSRLSLHSSNLGPVPPTPAGWKEDQPSPFNGIDREPLHLITTGSPLSKSAGLVSNPETSSAGIPSASTPGSGLVRKTAMRDRSAQGMRDRRPHSRIFSSQESQGLRDMSPSTNPWADAVESSNSATLPKLNGNPLSAKLVSPNQIVASPVQVSQTPPRSPNATTTSSSGVRTGSNQTAKAYPTPPPSQIAPLSATGAVPMFTSPVLPQANPENTIFFQDSLRRHQEFLNKELAASTDLERLEVFVAYLEGESYLRKERYESAFESDCFDVSAARLRCFATTRTRRASARKSDVTPVSLPESPAKQPLRTRTESTWWKDYQPALSPIASMDHDEMSSRGRAPSRWWESQTGSQGDGVVRAMHRSKRESKYMGLSKELLESLMSDDDRHDTASTPGFDISNGSYPNEKANPQTFGIYDEPLSTPTVFSSKQPAGPTLLDISRFITLPPPYPRHYPAVNNAHPELTQYRTTVRTLSDLSEVASRKARHKSNLDASRLDRENKLNDTRRYFRLNIQAQIQDGSISYAEAAEAEQALKHDEDKAERESLQAEFDTLQDVVVNPLHEILHERVTKLGEGIEQLLRDLFTDAETNNPDRPVVEGDDYPELLEKLTQLKWLFETREQIHKELFELLSSRNDAYKEIVVLPYRQANNLDKVRDTEIFFDRDTQTRYMSYCEESLHRHESFLQTIEDNVRRGVEVQSSAFWDIAPDLLDLLQKIPEDVEQLDIHIPEAEYAENPSYYQHPQQYLYSLLTHAEKSTYQYIEAQVNLQCLVHETKTSHLSAKYRLLQAQQALSSPTASDLREAQGHEEAVLTKELKNRASTIEGQWLEALGSQLHGTRVKVKQYLQHRDGWDDNMEEEDK